MPLDFTLLLSISRTFLSIQDASFTNFNRKFDF
jgi:hypothetical protein